MIVVLLHTNSFIFFFFIIFLSFLSSFLLFRAVCHLFCVISPFILSRCVCLRYFARNALRSCTNIYYLFICFFFRHKRGVCASVITICWAHSFFMNTHTHIPDTQRCTNAHVHISSYTTTTHRTEKAKQKSCIVPILIRAKNGQARINYNGLCSGAECICLVSSRTIITNDKWNDCISVCESFVQAITKQ